jgi:hypothetical protein
MQKHQDISSLKEEDINIQEKLKASKDSPRINLDSRIKILSYPEY